MGNEDRMMTARAKADLAAEKLAELAVKEGMALDLSDDRALALGWAAGQIAGVFRSLEALPLPTAEQAVDWTAEHGGTAHVLGESQAMVVTGGGQEVRLYDGAPLPVGEIPDGAYADIRRLRRTRTPVDARARVAKNVGPMIRQASRIMKAKDKAKPETKAETKGKTGTKRATKGKAKAGAGNS